MKIAILAGGKGTRLGPAHGPKAMVTIGGKPIICHIMDHYRRFGFDDFLIALGYHGRRIDEYFASLRDRAAALPQSNVFGQEGLASCQLIDTGLTTNTGGRIKRLAPYLGDETFMLTWCDGLADVDLGALLKFHRGHGKLATVTAVHEPPRFGRLTLHHDRVVSFSEKQIDRQQWINGAYFVLEPEVLQLIDNDQTSWEHGPLTQLASDNQLMAFRHEGFWQCMDTVAEQRELEVLWQSGAAPWAAHATKFSSTPSHESQMVAKLRESPS